MINDRIIVALDSQNDQELELLIKELHGTASYVKVGMELYYTYGGDIIKKLKDHDFKIFLDLKLHDIPNTVGNATKSLAKLGVDMLNVHAAGGSVMMQAAYENLKAVNQQAKLIAVTQLTSSNQNMLNCELKIPGELKDSVLNLAQLTYASQLDGIVCSAHEVSFIKKNLGNNFLCVTPGIRAKNTPADDQKRIMAPREALSMGSDFLVIGRPITKAKDIKQAYLNILEDIS